MSAEVVFGALATALVVGSLVGIAVVLRRTANRVDQLTQQVTEMSIQFDGMVRDCERVVTAVSRVNRRMERRQARE